MKKRNQKLMIKKAMVSQLNNLSAQKILGGGPNSAAHTCNCPTIVNNTCPTNCYEGLSKGPACAYYC